MSRDQFELLPDSHKFSFVVYALHNFRKKAILIGGGAVVLIAIIAVIAILAVNDGEESLASASSYDTSCTTAEKSSILGEYQSGAVSSDASQCAQIAKDMLMRNGTVVDAAVAAMFCVGVKNSQSCGLGGGFLATYYSKKDNQVYTLDAREIAPQLAYTDMYNLNLNHSAYTRIRLQKHFEDNGMQFNVSENTNRWWEKYGSPKLKGALSIAVPGEAAGLYELYRRFGGNLPWADLIEPTIKICEEGYNLTWYTGAITQMSAANILVEPSMRLFMKPGENKVLGQGDVVHRNTLALTLAALQKDPRALNEGPLASKLADDIMSFGGIVLEEDLKTYKPLWREPVKVHLKNGNFTVYSFPPPGAGAIVGLILNILDEYMLDENSLREDNIDKTQQVFAEAMKFAYGRRHQLGDLSPELAKAVVAELSSDELAVEIKSKINEMKTSQDPLSYGAKLSDFDDRGTAHLSVVAPNGDAIGITSSINYGYGAGVRSIQTGIILNNQMADFTELHTLVPGETVWMKNNLVEPGKRPLSSMSPTIVVDSKGDVRLVIGAAGGMQIPTAIAWTTSRNLWMNQNVKEAIDSCRSHHQLQPMVLQYETGFPKEQIEDLEAKGHVTKRLPFKSTVEAVGRSSTGTLEANADYRKSGEVAGF